MAVEVSVQLAAEGLTTSVKAGPHEFLADEPKEVGGEDKGPDPYELLLASLGACTVMTLRMYARRKGWNLTGAEVLLSHAKAYARDCEECETEGGKIDRIERQITLVGELDSEQRKRLLQIANHCPVHRSLTSEVWVVTELTS